MIKFPRVKYFISSNFRYCTKTVPLILRSIHGQVREKDTVLTISGCENAPVDFGISTFCVPYNSFEYTSLINIVDKQYSECEYAFLLHDTMVCGKDFFRMSMEFETDSITLAHEKGWCNIGMYPLKALHSQKNELMILKNMSKRLAIQKEGNIFDFKTYKKPTAINLNVSFRYELINRHVVYFESVDVYKFGSNDGVKFKKNIINDEL